MAKFARGKFAMKRPDKYVGTKSPTYRSSWEWSFMNFCDNNEHVLNGPAKLFKFPIEIHLPIDKQSMFQISLFSM